MTVVVFGSANIDSVVSVARHPRPGETVHALGEIRRNAGGKGLNQAIACRKSTGHETVFIGAVGADEAGEQVAEELESAGVKAMLRRETHHATGTALVVLDRHAENSIVVVAGANATLDGTTHDESVALQLASVVLFQGETPAVGFEVAARQARDGGATVVLNAAPVWPLSQAQAELVDVLVVNENECREIAKAFSVSEGHEMPDELCAQLAAVFPSVIVTLGAAGALWSSGGLLGRANAPTVKPVDTTGAGDTFCGVLCGSLARGVSLPEAVELGVRAASIAVTRHGTGSAAPHPSELLQH